MGWGGDSSRGIFSFSFPQDRTLLKYPYLNHLFITHMYVHNAVYFETYGCQMNVSDTEVAWSILKDAGYSRTTSMAEVLSLDRPFIKGCGPGYIISYTVLLSYRLM